MRKLPEGIRKILARFRYYLYIWKLIFSTAFKKIKYREKFKFLLITPEHSNLGDHAIAAAEEALFKDFFLFEITERSLDKFFKYFRHSLSLKLLFGKSDILINGGGFIGTIWPYTDTLVQQIIELLPNSSTAAPSGFLSTFAAQRSVLTVVATISGKTYYYPVVLDNATLERNKSYTVGLTITGLGSEDPNKPVEKGSLTASRTGQGGDHQPVARSPVIGHEKD